MRDPRILRTAPLGGMLLALTLATPATGQSLYRWTAPDGSVSFTDERERIPERHRDQAEALGRQGLDDYTRYTPVHPASPEQKAREKERLERLRAANAPPAVAARSGARTSAPASQDAVVELDDQTAVRIPSGHGGGGEGPLVVEEVRVKPKGHVRTTHDTVVRRGDEVLLVIREDRHQARPGEFVDEDDLLR